MQLEDRKKDEQQSLSKKELAFHASSDTDNSDDDEEEMSMLLRKFRRFLKYVKFRCFNCNKTGHMKKDYPLLKNKGKFKSKKFKKKKDYQASWRTVIPLPLMKKKPLHANICYIALEEDEV